MADEHKRPTPAPRKPRTGYHAVNVTPGYSPRPDIGYTTSSSVRYTAPVTPPSQLMRGGNNLHPIPPYIQQTSTPLPSTPNTYQPPVTPSSLYRPSQKKEYSGPNKVMTPQPMGGSEGFTPRKDSWSSSRSSLSSDPSSPARMISEDLSFEIEKLRDEIAQLKKQKEQAIFEVTEERKGLDELKTEHLKCTADLERVLNEEMSAKRRLAQREQNLQLMGRLSAGGDSEAEQKLKKREKELDEKEFALHEREARIRQKELEIKTEGDVLFQRKKELEIREYDLKNFQGPHQPIPGSSRDRHSDILGHEEREKDLQHKEQHLFQKENRLTDWEAQLKREQTRLAQREDKVHEEEERAQLNISRAKSMMQEANIFKNELKLKTEASGASNVPADDRMNTGNPGANIAITGTHGNIASNHGNPGVESKVVSSNVTVSEASKNEIDCSDDLMYARLMHMQLNADISEQDRLLAEQMSRTNPTPPDFLDTDAQLAYQQQMEIMGIAPGSADEEAFKKQLQEQLDRERKARESTARDEEIAASLRASD